MERVGRTLTGLALALFIVPLTLGRLKGLPRWGAAGVIAAVTLGSIGLAQLAIEQLVIRTTERTSGEERRVALIAMAGVNRIHAQDDGAPVLLVNDSFLPDALRGTIEGRVILAALPFLLANTQAAERRLVEVLTKAAEERIRVGYGTAEKIFNQAYVPLVGEYVGGLYDAYVTAANQARTAMRDRIERSDREWDGYVRRLAQNRLTPDQVAATPRLRTRVSQEIRKSIPFAPEGWVPQQKEDLDRLFEDEIRKEYRAGIDRIGLSRSAMPALDDFDRTVTPEAFVDHPHVRELFAQKVKTEVTDEPLAAALTRFGPRVGATAVVFPGFRTQVYEPVIQDQLDQERARLNSAVAAYGQGGRFAGDAYDAMKVVVVIPIAILFSMVGAVSHSLKAVFLVGRSLGLSRRGALAPTAAAAAVILMLGVWTRPSPALARPEVQALQRGVEAAFPAALVRLTLNLQTRIYPIGLVLRRAVGAA